MAAAQFVGRLYRSIRREPDVAFLALRMTCWVIVISSMARLCSIPRLFKLATPVTRGLFHSEERLAPTRLAAVVDAILRTNVAVLTPTCWKRAAILYRYLRLAGHAPHIVFGLTKAGDPPLAGHAWIEMDGRPMFEVTPPDFVEIYRFP